MKRVAAIVWFIILCTALSFSADVPTTKIKIDQVGYLPNAPKVALVDTESETFLVKRVTDGSIVLRGTLGASVTDRDTGDRIQTADFSALKAPGSYYLEIPGVGRSWNFAIGPDIFSHAYYLAMRAFYGQRCGTAVDLGKEFPGYKYDACHLNGVFNPSSGKQGPRANVGGWHDAGDYGRYVVNSGISTGTILWAYEMFGDKLKDRKLNIPETGNGTPDILNEARWNLEWMLKMQDDDGGVWHKQTSVHFAGFVMPQDDKLPSEVIGTGTTPYKSTCATGDLAAVAAIAARVYKPFDEKFAAQNLAAARKAWAWTEQNPNVAFKNPAGVSTGEYGDKQCGDERLWAAAELWRTTGEKRFQNYFLANYAPYAGKLRSGGPENWAQVSPMAMWTYILSKRDDSDPRALRDIRKATLDAAHEIAENTRANGYHVALKTTDYVWGSNSLVAGYGVHLLIANAIAPDEAFRNAALDNLHYLLGRNTFSISWVTQVGDNPFHHPHHRPSAADANAEPWPGLLSGGPNANRQDPATKALPELPPAKVYVDDQNSYASNEIAINWQAVLVFLLAGQLQ